jgi:hypothetical protein
VESSAYTARARPDARDRPLPSWGQEPEQEGAHRVVCESELPMDGRDQSRGWRESQQEPPWSEAHQDPPSPSNSWQGATAQREEPHTVRITQWKCTETWIYPQKATQGGWGSASTSWKTPPHEWSSSQADCSEGWLARWQQPPPWSHTTQQWHQYPSPEEGGATRIHEVRTCSAAASPSLGPGLHWQQPGWDQLPAPSARASKPAATPEEIPALDLDRTEDISRVLAAILRHQRPATDTEGYSSIYEVLLLFQGRGATVAEVQATALTSTNRHDQLRFRLDHSGLRIKAAYMRPRRIRS